MKKGFTLIELLAVIVILAVILIIAIPQVLKVVDDSRISAYIKNEQMVLKAVDVYVSRNTGALPGEIGDTTEVSINYLVTNGMLTEITNPYNKNEDCTGYVTIMKLSDTEYDYTPHLRCGLDIHDSSDDGLVGHWKLNGNALDYSSNNNHGTVFGTTFSTGRHGKENSAYLFDYTTDRIQIGNPSNTRISSELSISAWVNSRDVTKSQNSVSRNGPYFLRIVNSRLRVGVYTGTWIFRNGSIILNNDVWYNLVLTYDGNYVKGYVNGVLDISSPKTGNMTAWSNLFIGYTTSNGEQAPFDGIIEDVRLYSRALSSKEIKLLYESTK